MQALSHPGGGWFSWDNHLEWHWARCKAVSNHFHLLESQSPKPWRWGRRLLKQTKQTSETGTLRAFQRTCCNSSSNHSMISSWETSWGQFRPPNFIALAEHWGVWVQAKILFMIFETQPEAITRLCPAGLIRASCPPHTRVGTGSDWTFLERAAVKVSGTWISLVLMQVCIPAPDTSAETSWSGSWPRHFSLLWLGTFPLDPFLLLSLPALAHGPMRIQEPFVQCSSAMRWIPHLRCPPLPLAPFPRENGTIGRPGDHTSFVSYSATVSA